MSETKPSNTSVTQAAYWRAQLSSNLVTDQHRRDFEVWLAEKPEHKIAWLEINDFWRGLDNLTLADVTAPDYSRVISHDKPVRIRPKPRLALAIAASFLLLVSSALFIQSGFYFADYTTAPGEQRSLQLADGSEIRMNTGTAISVDYSQTRRQITLHDGEAYFAVAADADRPFQVQSGYGTVRALGTAFNVKIHQEQETVTVFQHAVKVTAEIGQVLGSLPEGREVVFTGSVINPVKTGALPRVKDWRNQRIVFQDRPLAEVIAELNRYRAGRIVMIGEAVKKFPVTGIFDTADTNIALKTIEQSLPVNVIRLTEKLVLLAAR